MRLFYASASFASSYGGPAYSVPRLARAIAETGADVALWAPDGSALTLSMPERALRRLAGSITEALRRFGRPDVIHDSGLWLAHNHAIATFAARNDVPLVISTRGMLDPWALDHKRLKKAIAWHLYQKRNLNLADMLHVTSAEEKENVTRLGLRPPVRQIPNGIDLPDCSDSLLGGELRRAVFLGRLHPVKGLPMLLDAWATLRPAGWELVVAGPDENGYRATLDVQVRSLGLDGAVRFTGAVMGGNKEELMRGASLFILPSHSESFGMVVAEACSFGIPVLTTTAVPWPQLERHECGWRAAPTVTALTESLQTAITLPDVKLREMGERARQLVEAEFSWTAIAQQFLDLYSGLMVRRSVSEAQC